MGAEAAVLRELAELFKPQATLYAVGGYSRSLLLGVPPRDIDICSKLALEDVKKLLSCTRFVVSAKSMRLGTATLSADGVVFEYTAFRTDSYPAGSGAHRPERVAFTEDMRADALRRDFTANAVYFDPLTESFVDLCGGEHDIEARVLRAVREPDSVFGEDGLRVLRLVRFAAELGFEPDAETFAAAKRNAWRVRDIVRERIFAELDRIFVADTAYPSLGVDDGHVRGLRLLGELGLEEMLLPELYALNGLEQPGKYHIYDAHRHSVEAYAAAPPEIRWAALLHDVGKRAAQERQGNMHGHDRIGAELVAGRLSALGMPHSRARRVVELVALHMTDLKGDMSETKLRLFCAGHASIMRELILLKRADAFATAGRSPAELRMERVWREISSDGTPLSVADLPVNGRDAEAAGLKGAEIGEALSALWREAVANPVLRERAKAFAFLVGRAEKAGAARNGEKK